MTRIAPIDPTIATGETAAALETARTLFGGTPNFVTTVAHSPAAAGAPFAMFAHLRPDAPAPLVTTPTSMTRRAP